MCVVSSVKKKSIARKSLIRTLIFTLAILWIGSTFEPYNQAQLAVVLILL
jgi:branched-chain amino acid transport system permease protein